MNHLEQSIKRMAQMIKTNKNVVVFTGAGISTESGIPDFRSSKGLWAGIDPQEIASADAMKRDPRKLALFYRERIKENLSHKPNRSHHILNEWLLNDIIKHIATQNVDGYHSTCFETAHQISELHGNFSLYCTQCGEKYDKEYYLGPLETFCICEKCEGFVRPNIVLFGEQLPTEAYQKAKKIFKRSQLCLVIGTSASVYPANGLPQMSRSLTIINKTETDLDHMASIKINKMSASVVLEAIDYELKES
ncbi:NAD-dependent protein deacetylase [compost metagenome]